MAAQPLILSAFSFIVLLLSKFLKVDLLSVPEEQRMSHWSL